MKTIVVVFLEFINVLAMVFRLVVKTGVAICRIAVNLSLGASSGGKRQRIQHVSAHGHKVNKELVVAFTILSIIWSCERYNRYRTDLRDTWPSLFTPSARSQKSRAETFHYAPRG